ncbi:MAG: ImmA/IrrE family metallo-endopeptidase [Flavisolibacter sp.]|nr:ImmA/IrrE family metallo-endopeptidase [Flavisolibacter sp.]
MFDLNLLAKKLTGCRSRLEYSYFEISEGTGIKQDRLIAFEQALIEPTGDEILILADFFREDYKYFISNQQSSASENTDSLYRQFDKEFTKEDRRAVQEFLYICECEADIWSLLEENKKPFQLSSKRFSTNNEAEETASAVRIFLGYKENELLQNIFDDFRNLGLHIFRRKLHNSGLSGIFIQHPVAGKCILVNYSEDLYRQNFTISHEVAHSIFDTNQLYNVSFTKDGKDIKEIRANRFAAGFLMPAAVLKRLKVSTWSEEILIKLASQFRVNVIALLYRLTSLELITQKEFNKFKELKLSKEFKEDPELKDLPSKIALAKMQVLERGLSTTYVRKCHEAYSKSLISQSRLAEILLTSEHELQEVLALFNLKLVYDF